MFVKMLTHMHMVVYTWWCWHICRGGRVPFEKNKCIFSIALVESLEKSEECFSLRNTHRTLVLVAPDTGPKRPMHYQLLAQA